MTIRNCIFHRPKFGHRMHICSGQEKRKLCRLKFIWMECIILSYHEWNKCVCICCKSFWMQQIMNNHLKRKKQKKKNKRIINWPMTKYMHIRTLGTEIVLRNFRLISFIMHSLQSFRLHKFDFFSGTFAQKERAREMFPVKCRNLGERKRNCDVDVTYETYTQSAFGDL